MLLVSEVYLHVNTGCPKSHFTLKSCRISRKIIRIAMGIAQYIAYSFRIIMIPNMTIWSCIFGMKITDDNITVKPTFHTRVVSGRFRPILSHCSSFEVRRCVVFAFLLISNAC